jgi:hypothetical protein
VLCKGLQKDRLQHYIVEVLHDSLLHVRHVCQQANLSPHQQGAVQPAGSTAPAASVSCTADVIRDASGRVSVVLDEEVDEPLPGEGGEGEEESGPPSSAPKAEPRRITVVGLAAVNEALARRQTRCVKVL